MSKTAREVIDVAIGDEVDGDILEESRSYWISGKVLEALNEAGFVIVPKLVVQEAIFGLQLTGNTIEASGRQEETVAALNAALAPETSGQSMAAPKS